MCYFSGLVKKVTSAKVESNKKIMHRSLFSPGKYGVVDDELATPLLPASQVKSTGKHHVIKTPVTSSKPQLKHMISFRSLKTSAQLLPVTKCIANGSVRKGVSLLLHVHSKDKTVKESAVKAIQQVVDEECTSLSKRNVDVDLRKTEIQELESFDLKKIQTDFQKHTPLLWAFATTAGTSKCKKAFDCAKVIAALCVLIQSRSRLLNVLQHTVAISMYNNQLQKDGFHILSKLGFSVSHSTMNETLNLAKSQHENTMKSHKESLSTVSSQRDTSDISMVNVEGEYSNVGPLSSVHSGTSDHSSLSDLPFKTSTSSWHSFWIQI